MLLDCAAAGTAAQQQRLAGGAVTRAAGRQLRGMREGVVAPAAVQKPGMDLSPESAQLHHQVGMARAYCDARRWCWDTRQAVCVATHLALASVILPLWICQWIDIYGSHQHGSMWLCRRDTMVVSASMIAFHTSTQVVGWQHDPPSSLPPEAVEAVLLWADPWLSAKVFGAGLYALICFRQVAAGEETHLIPGCVTATSRHRQ